MLVYVERDGVVRTAVPYYSTDIAAAWQVAEKMVTLGYVVTVDIGLDYPSIVELCDKLDPPALRSIEVHADTAPLAICLAALRTVQEEAPCDTL